MYSFELLQMPRAVGARQLVQLGCDDRRGHSQRAKPSPRVQIGFQSRMAAVDQEQHEKEGKGVCPLFLALFPAVRKRGLTPFPEVPAGNGLELLRCGVTTSRISVARQIHQIKRRHSFASHPIKVREARLSRRGARARNFVAHQRVNQTRLADVRAPDQRQFGQTFPRKACGVDGAGDEFGLDLHAKRERGT